MPLAREIFHCWSLRRDDLERGQAWDRPRRRSGRRRPGSRAAPSTRLGGDQLARAPAPGRRAGTGATSSALTRPTAASARDRLVARRRTPPAGGITVCGCTGPGRRRRPAGAACRGAARSVAIRALGEGRDRAPRRRRCVGIGHERVPVGHLHRHPWRDQVGLHRVAVGAGAGQQHDELGRLHRRPVQHVQARHLAQPPPGRGDAAQQPAAQPLAVPGQQRPGRVDAGHDRARSGWWCAWPRTPGSAARRPAARSGPAPGRPGCRRAAPCARWSPWRPRPPRCACGGRSGWKPRWAAQAASTSSGTPGLVRDGGVAGQVAGGARRRTGRRGTPRRPPGARPARPRPRLHRDRRRAGRCAGRSPAAPTPGAARPAPGRAAATRCRVRVTIDLLAGLADGQGQRLVAVRRAGHREPAPVRAPQPRRPGASASASSASACLIVSSPPYSGASPATTAPTRSWRCLWPGTLIGVSSPGLGLRGEAQPGVQQRGVGGQAQRIARVGASRWDGRGVGVRKGPHPPSVTWYRPAANGPGQVRRRRAGLVPVERPRSRRQRGVAQDQVGGLLGDHHDRRVDVAVGDVGHGRGVDDPQAVQAVHPHRWPGRPPTSAPVPIAQVHDGCRAVSPSRRTQSRICSSVRTAGPGDSSPRVERVERGLGQDRPGDPDGLDPLPAVLVAWTGS